MRAALIVHPVSYGLTSVSNAVSEGVFYFNRGFFLHLNHSKNPVVMQYHWMIDTKTDR